MQFRCIGEQQVHPRWVPVTMGGVCLFGLGTYLLQICGRKMNFGRSKIFRKILTFQLILMQLCEKWQRTDLGIRSTWDRDDIVSLA